MDNIEKTAMEGENNISNTPEVTLWDLYALAFLRSGSSHRYSEGPAEIASRVATKMMGYRNQYFAEKQNTKGVQSL